MERGEHSSPAPSFWLQHACDEQAIHMDRLKEESEQSDRCCHSYPTYRQSLDSGALAADHPINLGVERRVVPFRCDLQALSRVPNHLSKEVGELKITRVSLQSHEGADCLFLNWIASSEHCQGQCVSGGRGFRRLTALGLTTLVVLVFGTQLAPSWLWRVPQLELPAIADSGTLFAFCIVSTTVLRLRKTDLSRVRPFRVPAVWILAPLSVAGCVLLFLFLSTETKFVLLVWSAIGLLIYFSFRVRKWRWEQFNKA